MPAVTNRSPRSDRRSAASITEHIHGSERNSFVDGISGTFSSFPFPRYGDPVRTGGEDAVPLSIVHPSAPASTAMENGTRAVANPMDSCGCRASVAIMPVSKFASGHAHPQAPICCTVAVWVNIAGGGGPSLPPSMASMISSLVFTGYGPEYALLTLSGYGAEVGLP